MPPVSIYKWGWCHSSHVSFMRSIFWTESIAWRVHTDSSLWLLVLWEISPLWPTFHLWKDVKKEQRTAAGRQTWGNARVRRDSSLLIRHENQLIIAQISQLARFDDDDDDDAAACPPCWKSREHLSSTHSQTSVGSQQKCPEWFYYRVILGTSVILYRKGMRHGKKDFFYPPSRGRW